MNRRPIDLLQLDALTRPAEPYLSCEQCLDELDAHVEAVLAGHAGDVRPGMHAHLATCPACAEEAESLLALVRSIADEETS